MQRDSLADQEARAREAVQALMARIEQLRLDAQREAGLATDADDYALLDVRKIRLDVETESKELDATDEQNGDG